MFYCKKCGEKFKEPMVIVDPPVYGDEDFPVCPICGAEEIEEYEPCPLCGKGEQIFLPMCRACALKEVDAMIKEAEMFGGAGRGSILTWLRKQMQES